MKKNFGFYLNIDIYNYQKLLIEKKPQKILDVELFHEKFMMKRCQDYFIFYLMKYGLFRFMKIIN